MLEAVVNRFPKLPAGTKILVFGGGFSGQHFAKLGRRLGAEVLCSRRTKDKIGTDFVFDSTKAELLSDHVLSGTTHILSCIPPDENGQDPVLNSLKGFLQQLPLKWVGYLSTTGVYGDSKGEWVDESTTPYPNQLRSKRRLECEQQWQKSGLPAQILRLPGIYGPGRSAFESIIQGKCRLINKPGQIFSRIHIDDIAGAAIHLLLLANKGIKPEIINISDNLPSTNIDVLNFAAKLINYSLPPEEEFEFASATMSPMALSFWKENRRVSNKLLCKGLNYSLVHPDYRSGLKECLLTLNNDVK
ncbi:SDR family oxidoreductase [Prochlorococcus sp. MIT 1223]|uniref:SDR family oxidoreductase n=1 Tax=Prochlorococcus sp. MIT 1223 TaxID=3096217 RepID=UPI002A75F990|nr:SDR family oxidoreductase [Prochlorococcus sp. MIT 1223]